MRRGRNSSLTGAIVVSAALAIALSGCSVNGSAVEDYKGPPKGTTSSGGNRIGQPYATWMAEGDRIAITLFGSSSCPPIGKNMTATSSNALKVTLKDPPDKACTADLGPHTTVFSTPSEVTTSSDVTIVIDSKGYDTITLKALG